jgi:hypothetical protein
MLTHRNISRRRSHQAANRMFPDEVSRICRAASPSGSFRCSCPVRWGYTVSIENTDTVMQNLTEVAPTVIFGAQDLRNCLAVTLRVAENDF